MPDIRPPVILDIGARFGLNPSLRAFSGFARFHLVEPDPQEAARLSERYAGAQPQIQVHPLALSKEPGELRLKLREHRALSSFFEFNAELFQNLNYMEDEIVATDEIPVPVSTVDALFASEPIDILKTDTEGADFDVLTGARQQLRDHVLAVRSEVTFCEVIPGQPMFGDINKLLYDQGFQLLSIDYAGQGVARSPYARPGRFGQLLTSDATWVKRDEFLYGTDDLVPVRAAMILARFLFHNNATDVAVWHLCACLERDPNAFKPHLGTPLMEGLRADVAKLIKDLSYVPGNRHTDLITIYEQVFSDKFPNIYEYYYNFE